MVVPRLASGERNRPRAFVHSSSLSLSLSFAMPAFPLILALEPTATSFLAAPALSCSTLVCSTSLFFSMNGGP